MIFKQSLNTSDRLRSPKSDSSW